MVFMVWPETAPVHDTQIVILWHIVSPESRSLCERFEVLFAPLERHFFPQGANCCTRCVNELLRRLALNLIGVQNASQAQTPR
jgi:hypothetical protein